MTSLLRKRALLSQDCTNRLSPRDEKLPFRLKYDVLGSEVTDPHVYKLGTTELSDQLHAPAMLSPGKGPPFSSGLREHRAGLSVLDITNLSRFYLKMYSNLGRLS